MNQPILNRIIASLGSRSNRLSIVLKQKLSTVLAKSYKGKYDFINEGILTEEEWIEVQAHVTREVQEEYEESDD